MAYKLLGQKNRIFVSLNDSSFESSSWRKSDRRREAQTQTSWEGSLPPCQPRLKGGCRPFHVTQRRVFFTITGEFVKRDFMKKVCERNKSWPRALVYVIFWNLTLSFQSNMQCDLFRPSSVSGGWKKNRINSLFSHLSCLNEKKAKKLRFGLPWKAVHS